MTPDQFRYILRERRITRVNYVQRYHRICTGTEEIRDWCTADVVWQHMQPICSIYRVNPDTSISSLEKLMVTYLFDLCVTVGDRITESAAIVMIRSPTKEYEHVVLALEDILLTGMIEALNNTWPVSLENPHPV